MFSTKSLIILALIAVAALVWLPRKSVETRLLIEAPPKAVWAALTDTGNYAAWNPIFVGVSGDMRPDGELALDMKLEDGKVSQITVTVDAMIEYRSIQQSAGVPGILTAHHEWLLEPATEGTLVVQRESYRGVGVLFYDPAYVELLYAEGLKNLRAVLTDA